MAKNSKYWQGRFDQIEQAANNKSVRYASKLEKKYKQAASEIDAQINKWYNRIARNNEITMSEARRLLSAGELKEFKWTVEEYIERGRQNAIDQSWMKELENASAKFHINRLEAMKLECRHQIEMAMANGQQDMFDTLSSVYKDTFYRSHYELQKGVGVGFDVSKLDDNMVSRLLNKPWAADGTNFSQKLWGNKTKLINRLDEELSRMVLTGETPKRAIQNIKDAMNSSLFQAKRLVLTEQAYFTSEAQKKTFAELDVERFEVLSSMDMKVCPVCAANDKKVHPMTEFHVGITAPPFHPLCRCVTAPFFDDEFATGTRIARDAEGETYTIPNNTTYDEWKKAFVDGGSKEGFELAEDYVRQTVTISKKQHKTDKWVVDRELVNSKKYHDKFENLTEHKAVNETLYQESMRMLEHRDGTYCEDMIAIDARTGEVIDRFTTSTAAGKVTLTEEEVEKLLSYKSSMILLHNHPSSGRLSHTDIAKLQNAKIEAVVASGHDGSVYIGSQLKENFNVDEFWKEAYNGYKVLYKDEVLASYHATNDLYALKVFKTESR